MAHWTERHRSLLAVFIILERADGKILLTRRAGTGYMDGKLGLPSGHVDGNEPAEQALVREAKEEIGVGLAVTDMRHAHTMHRLAETGTHEYIDLFFTTKTWRGDPAIMEPDKCSELVWADPQNLPDDMVPAVRAATGRWLAGEAYSGYNF
ncbi:MAG TPA: NUDIX domain-containing protein [Candidatus Saccharimonadales bacterium]|nr:NUDIX domain-containing protein [Candidatus Saccharimonadales bacterium]